MLVNVPGACFCIVMNAEEEKLLSEWASAWGVVVGDACALGVCVSNHIAAVI